MISGEETPRCPDGGKFPMERVMSGFSVTGRHRELDGSGEGPDPDDPRLEAAMAELEGQMSGMDEDNPDPRQMGRMMRRMSELTGEPMDGQMEEMVRKMEEGTDLDALEDEFGDTMDESGLDDSGEADSSKSEKGKALRRMFQATRTRAPKKDPTLYDWRDFS